LGLDRELWKTRIVVNIWLIVTNMRFKKTYKIIHLFPAGSKLENSENLQFYWKICCEVEQLDTTQHRATGQLDSTAHRATPPRK
jgi:hypothetical protein